MQSIERFVEGQYYNIYNRGINGCDIFPEDRNFDHFMKLYVKHVASIFETFAYCLLRNHFHLLIRIKSQTEVGSSFDPSKKFSNLFNAYAQGFNKTYSRTGGLFETPFRRKRVEDMDYKRWLVWYIHANPQRHGLTDDFRGWPGSSFQLFANQEQNEIVSIHKTIDWFDGLKGFLQFHLTNKKDLDGYVIEE